MADVVVTEVGANSIEIVYPSGADGISAFLSPPSLAVVANSDGSSPVLTQAASTLSIMRGGTDISALYSLVCTPSAGITGSLVGKTYTVSGMTNDTESVTFVASRSGYSNITLVFYIAKVRKSADATTSTKGIVQLAADGGTTASTVVQATDSRLAAASTSNRGTVTLAVDGGTTASTVVQATDSRLASTSETNRGTVELANNAEIVAGSNTSRVASVGNLKTALATDGMWLVKNSKVPDAVTYIYKSDFAVGGDSWSIVGGFEGQTAQTYTNGVLRATVQSGKTYIAIQRSITGGTGKYALLRLRASTSMSVDIKAVATLRTVSVTTIESYFLINTALDGDVIVLLSSGRSAGDYLEVVDVRVGTMSLFNVVQYLPRTITEEAARILCQLADTPGAGTRAYTTLTSSGVQVTAGKKVNLPGKSYTFVATEAELTFEGAVLMGSNAADAMTYLASAIRRSPSAYDASVGGTSGKWYYAAAAHPLASSSGNVSPLPIRSIENGIKGNLITVTTDEPTYTISVSPMTDGIDEVGAKIIAQISEKIAGAGTRPAAAKVDITSTSLIGYEQMVDVASGGTLTLPAGGTWLWECHSYGATISSAKRGSSAGGTTLTVAGANCVVKYRRYA
jgi:hypothetical protein